MTEALHIDDNLKSNKFNLLANEETLNITETVWGNGPIKILALHGWTKDGTETIEPFIRNLSPSTYTVYMPNFPGLKSEEPSKPWGVEEYTNFAISYLNKHKVDTPIDIIGHSFGGRVGILLGSTHPKIVNKLVLIDSAGIYHEKPFVEKVRLKTFKSIRSSLQKIQFNSAASKLQEWYSKRYGSEDYKNTSGVMRQSFVKIINKDLLGFAKQIKAPTLLIWGSNDQETPLSDAKALEKIIPDCGLVTINNAGHFSHLEHPKETARIINHFFTH